MILYYTECHDCYIEYSGDNLDNPIDSFEGGPRECQGLCAATEGCKFFTWRNAGTCLLKTKVGNKNGNLNAISGIALNKCVAGNELEINNRSIRFRNISIEQINLEIFLCVVLQS